MCGKLWSVAIWRRRSGFLLFEAILCAALLSMAAYMVLPRIWDRQQERTLELATETVVTTIRQVQTDVKNEGEKYENYGNPRSFYIKMKGDRVEYFTRKGASKIRPKGVLPEGIRLVGNPVKMTFGKRGGTYGSDYHIVLATKDGAHQTEIIVAVYTGRVRSVKYR